MAARGATARQCNTASHRRRSRASANNERRRSRRLTWLLRQRFTALARGLAGARAGDVTAIHQARVATRRLREALPLVTSGGAGRKLERTIRRLTRALGPVRELDVALQTLDELRARRRRAARRASPACGSCIAAERQTLHAEAVKAIDRVDLERGCAGKRWPRAARGRRRRRRTRASAPRAAARRASRGTASRGDRQRRRHLPARSSARGPHRRQEAALCHRDGTSGCRGGSCRPRRARSCGARPVSSRR